jgi:hypothetical protein
MPLAGSRVCPTKKAGHLNPAYELLLALAEALGIQPSALVALAEQLKESSET